MADGSPTLLQARHVDEWTIVRLPDGRLGSLSKRGSRPVVCTVEPGREGWAVGVEIASTDVLEVVAFPARLAQEWLRSGSHG